MTLDYWTGVNTRKVQQDTLDCHGESWMITSCKLGYIVDQIEEPRGAHVDEMPNVTKLRLFIVYVHRQSPFMRVMALSWI
jgi:hypothetical protein